MNRRIQGEPLENGSDLAGDVINNKITTSHLLLIFAGVDLIFCPFDFSCLFVD